MSTEYYLEKSFPLKSVWDNKHGFKDCGIAFEKVGKSKFLVTQRLDLTRIPKDVRDYINANSFKDFFGSSSEEAEQWMIMWVSGDQVTGFRISGSERTRYLMISDLEKILGIRLISEYSEDFASLVDI